MVSRTCKYCSQEVVGAQHHCAAVGKTLCVESDEGDFLLSAAVAAVTDSCLLGAVVGGDLTGAIVGDLLGDFFD